MKWNTISNFYSKTYFSISSQYSVSEALEALKLSIRFNPRTFFYKQGLGGYVKQTKVSIYRSIPFVENSFIPVFVGEVHHMDSGSELVGYFSGHWFVRVFMIIWISMLMTFSLQFLVQEIQSFIRNPSLEEINPSVFILFGLWIFAYLTIKIGMWFARNDMNYISSALRLYLNSGDRF